MATLQTWPAHGPLQWELQPLSKGCDGPRGLQGLLFPRGGRAAQIRSGTLPEGFPGNANHAGSPHPQPPSC